MENDKKYRVSWVENGIGFSEIFTDYNKAAAFCGQKELESEFTTELEDKDGV